MMTPGKVHEYASCTTFSTPSEYMEGHYTFHRLGEALHLRGGSDALALLLMSVCLSANKEEVFQVAIPRFHMVCPPYREPHAPTVRRQHRTSTS